MYVNANTVCGTKCSLGIKNTFFRCPICNDRNSFQGIDSAFKISHSSRLTRASNNVPFIPNFHIIAFSRSGI